MRRSAAWDFDKEDTAVPDKPVPVPSWVTRNFPNPDQLSAAPAPLQRDRRFVFGEISSLLRQALETDIGTRPPTGERIAHIVITYEKT